MILFKRIAFAALILSVPLAQAATKPAAKPAAKPVTKPAAKPAAKPVAQPPAAKPKPVMLNVALKDGFGVMQVASGDVTKFIADWKVGMGPKSATTRTVADKPLFTFLIIQGCKPDPMGNCDVVADFVITRPDGTTNEDNKGVVVWNKPPGADPKKPIIGDGALGYGVDSEGPFGDYVVVATVTDRVAGVTVTTQQTLTIKPAADGPPK